MTTGVRDAFGRPLRDLRVSVTDRCNFRCRYCMPREVFGADFAFLDRDELLRFEELETLVRVFAGLGVDAVRLTGGEPLLRRDLPDLVARLAAIDGINDLALTTNGTLLPRFAGPLAQAGLDRVTVSLDALEDKVHRAVSDTTVPVSAVLEGIAAAQDAGLGHVKVNSVVMRGANEDQILPLARYGREHGVTVRFIEYMDVGTTNGWRLDDVVTAAEILETISREWPIEPVREPGSTAPAERYRYLDGAGDVGVVASVTRPFCRTCTRVRLSSVGELFTCLFAASGHDLRGLLRGGVDGETLAAEIAGIWGRRTDRYSEQRTEQTPGGPKVEMSYIGG